MKFTVEGIDYQVKFYHDQLRLDDPIDTRCVGATDCSIRYTIYGNTVYVLETASCSIDDNQFVKAVGRKVSFARALKTLFPTNRLARRIAWTQYWAEHKK